MAAFSLSTLVLPFFLFLLVGVHADVDSYYQSTKYEKGSAGKWPNQRFQSSQLTAPVLNFVRYGQACRDGLYTFIAPRGSSVPKAGPMILDQDGHLVWSEPMGETFGMNMHTYKGESYLTFWVGDDSMGHGEGTYYMINKTYQIQYKFDGANGLRGDLHEFHITRDDTAVYTIYDKVPADLSSVGGSKDGWLWDGTFQEVNPETGELLFQWRASEHLPFHEAYRDREGHGDRESDPWDFFHINSVDKDAKGNFLISSRYYFALIYIDGRSGEIIWKLGGKDNMFTDLSDGGATNMSYQHHARWREDGKSITLFDNSGRGAGAPSYPSRGLWIDVDQEKMTAKVHGQYWNPTPILSQSQGSVDVLESGNVLVGYGYNAAWTEYTPDGKPLCEVHMGPQKFFNQGHIISYRVHKDKWEGRPLTKPSWVIPNGHTGYVSWNGATEVTTWIVEGSHAADLDHYTGAFDFVSATPKAGFETAISISENITYPHLRVVALDKEGTRIGASEFVKINVDDDDWYDESERDRVIFSVIFFIVGFTVCGILVACNWARKTYLPRWTRPRPKSSRGKRNWWDNLRFVSVKSDDDDGDGHNGDDDVEDLSSEMQDLIAAHAEEFELGDGESDEDIDEPKKAEWGDKLEVSGEGEV